MLSHNSNLTFRRGAPEDSKETYGVQILMKIGIPAKFFEVMYDGSQYPGVASGLAQGANCQHYCYELLRFFGFNMGELRSSDLWEDRAYTELVTDLQLFDLVLFNSDSNSYGAHVGICVGPDSILHLSKQIGHPVVWPMGKFKDHEEYRTLIGIKRPIKNQNIGI